MNNEFSKAKITTDPDEKLLNIFRKIITKLFLPSNEKLYSFKVYTPDYDPDNIVNLVFNYRWISYLTIRISTTSMIWTWKLR